MQRRFIEVEGRRVHYRRAGDGPPLVMLHGSPGNSEMLASEMAAASKHFTCFALDTPGFGGSDPLPGETLGMRDLASATAAAMREIGLPPCPVYGTHTGAVIGAELAVGWSEQVTGVVLEGFPIFTDDEIATIFSPAYFSSLVTDPLGGHLTSTWVRFRDQFTWFPWASRDVTRLNPVDRPAPEDIHHWVMMFYRSCRSYGPAYRAACFHGHRAYLAADALTVPAVYMASAEDMLYPHLDRLPTLKAGQRVERLSHDPAAKYAAIATFARSMPQAPNVSVAPSLQPAGNDPAVQFVDTPTGQMFVRFYGEPAATPLILLHDAPGSGFALDGIARALAKTHYVVLPDLPGNGESDDPAGAGSEDSLAACAAGVVAIIDAFALKDVTVGAVGCGCAVAALLTRDPRIAEIVLENAPTPSAAVAAAIAPDLPITADASHWLKAWLMVRDTQIYDPWYVGTIAAQRTTQGNFDADWLHTQTFEIMKARESYHRLPRAAWAFDPSPALANATVPVRQAALLSLLGQK
jgi:pimeloyl-ACP methyl ester carboxylesterase